MFSKNIKIAEDLDGIVVKCNTAAALRWNGNSETWNKEAELAHSFPMYPSLPPENIRKP